MPILRLLFVVAALMSACKSTNTESKRSQDQVETEPVTEQIIEPTSDKEANKEADSDPTADKVMNPPPSIEQSDDAEVRVKPGQRLTPHGERKSNLALTDEMPYMRVTVTGGHEIFYDDYLTFWNPVDISGKYSFATIRVTNYGEGRLDLGTIRGYEGVEIEQYFSSHYLEKGQSTTARIRIKRQDLAEAGWHEGYFEFTHNDYYIFTPFRVFVEWYVPESPYLQVKISNTNIEMGATLSVFEATPIDNTPVWRDVYLYNTGTSNLTLPPGSITLTNDIELIEDPASSLIRPGQYTFFRVGYRYNGKSPGYYTGQVLIASNDTERNPFQFLMQFRVPNREWKFRTDAPALHFTKRPTISWESSFGATSYDIYISSASNCALPYVQSYTDVTVRHLKLSSNLEDGVYYLCGNAKANGHSPYPSSIGRFEIEMDRMFRELPDNQNTTWIPADKMTYLLHFNEDFIVGDGRLANSAVPNQDATYFGSGMNKAENAKLANGINLAYGHVRLDDTGGVSPDSATFSMAFWMMQRNNHGYQTLYEDYGSKNLNWMEASLIGGYLEFRLRDDSGRFRHLRHDQKLNLNQWYHVAITSDAQSTILYLNGAQVKTNTISTMGAIRLTGGKAPIIGASADNPNIENFHGVMDEFAFWKDQKLTDTHIQRMFFFQNTHHNANNPILTAYTQGIKTFSGNPENFGYDVGRELDKDYTVTFSVKPNSIQSVTDHGGNYMFGKFYGGRHYTIACIYFNQTHELHGGFYCNQLRLGTNSDRRSIGSLHHKINNDTFHHIAVSKRGSTLRLYLNGALINSLPDALMDVGGNGPLVAGGRFVQDHLDGQMKNLKVFVKALTDQEISTIATSDR